MTRWCNHMIKYSWGNCFELWDVLRMSENWAEFERSWTWRIWHLQETEQSGIWDMKEGTTWVSTFGFPPIGIKSDSILMMKCQFRALSCIVWTVELLFTFPMELSLNTKYLCLFKIGKLAISISVKQKTWHYMLGGFSYKYQLMGCVSKTRCLCSMRILDSLWRTDHVSYVWCTCPHPDVL